jgi:hypothetical protein
VPCGTRFSYKLVDNEKSLDLLIAKRAAEIDNAA